MALLSLPATAWAGNDDSVLVGTQGARLGGAVTASVTDSTALWYNPGAIGRSRWAQFGVTGNLIQLRITSIDHVLRADSGPSRDITYVETNSLPTTLAHEIPLPSGWALAYGAFATQGESAAAHMKLRGLNDDELNEISLAVTSSSTLYHFGGGLGIPLTERLRIGVAVFGVYETARSAAVFSAGVGGLDSPSLSTSDMAARSSGAVQVSAGVQWSPSAAWDLGVAINSPRLLLVSTNDILDSFTLVDDTGSTLHSVTNDVGASARFAFSAPIRVRAGIAHHAGKLSVMLDADIQSGLRNDALGIDRRVTPNVRTGVDYLLDDAVRLGVGLFTDLASDRDASNRTHFFGVSGGFETTTRYELADEEPASAIEFSTFVGLRYALGIGLDQQRGVAIHGLSQSVPIGASPGDVIVHEIGLNIGSGLRF